MVSNWGVGADGVSGIDALKWDDQQKIRKLFGGGDAAAEEGSADGAEAKRRKTEAKEQNQIYFGYYDKLMKLHMRIPREILDFNGANSGGGERKIVEKCADGM